MTTLLHATNPLTRTWSLTPTHDAHELDRVARWYRAQLEGIDGAELDVIERDGAREQLIRRERFTADGWTVQETP